MDSRIEKAVDDFWGDYEFVYAIPGTENHTANFYGDTEVCELTRQDVINLIEIARDSWTWDDDQDATKMAVASVIADLQEEKPDQ